MDLTLPPGVAAGAAEAPAVDRGLPAWAEPLWGGGALHLRGEAVVGLSDGLAALLGPAAAAALPVAIGQAPWIPSEDRQRLATAWARAVPGLPFTLEHRLLAADGRRLPVVHRGLRRRPAGAAADDPTDAAALDPAGAEGVALLQALEAVPQPGDALPAPADGGRSAALLAALPPALAAGELSLAYQPQLCCRSGRIIGAEALLRWLSPEHGEVPVAEFLPLAERSGQIAAIGRWVLHEACAQWVRWRAEGLVPPRVAVNVSPLQVQVGDLAQTIEHTLAQTGATAAALALELTERALGPQPAAAVATLRRLRALGVEIGLDDFGTGASSLSLLRTLPIDLVKVDRSLVSDVTAAPEAASVTRSIIRLAHELRIPVLAEGVETPGQLQMLRAHGCDRLQGFVFSPPVAAAELAAMLRAGRGLEPLATAQPAGARTLLLVDDETHILSALRRLFRRDGYRVLTATSGAEGLEQLAREPVDVIVSDQRMPGMTGVDFLRRAKELHPHTVRMTLSGYTDLQSIIDAVNEGAVYKFLTKPWDDERLRGHVAQAFEHKALADENRRLQAEVAALQQRLPAVG